LGREACDGLAHGDVGLRGDALEVEERDARWARAPAQLHLDRFAGCVGGSGREKVDH
jgi:hypothetical protein